MVHSPDIHSYWGINKYASLEQWQGQLSTRDRQYAIDIAEIEDWQFDTPFSLVDKDLHQHKSALKLEERLVIQHPLIYGTKECPFNTEKPITFQMCLKNIVDLVLKTGFSDWPFYFIYDQDVWIIRIDIEKPQIALTSPYNLFSQRLNFLLGKNILPLKDIKNITVSIQEAKEYLLASLKKRDLVLLNS